MPDSNPIFAFRRKYNLSLRRLATQARVDFRRLHLAERGLRLRQDEAARLAPLIGCDPRELTGGADA